MAPIGHVLTCTAKRHAVIVHLCPRPQFPRAPMSGGSARSFAHLDAYFSGPIGWECRCGTGYARHHDHAVSRHRDACVRAQRLHHRQCLVRPGPANPAARVWGLRLATVLREQRGSRVGMESALLGARGESSNPDVPPPAPPVGQPACWLQIFSTAPPLLYFGAAPLQQKSCWFEH